MGLGCFVGYWVARTHTLYLIAAFRSIASVLFVFRRFILIQGANQFHTCLTCPGCNLHKATANYQNQAIALDT